MYEALIQDPDDSPCHVRYGGLSATNGELTAIDIRELAYGRDLP
jgi:hypothetical protein